MTERRQVRLGLVGFGEVGGALGYGLREQGLEHVVAYDHGAMTGPFAALKQRRADDSGVTLVPSLAALAERSELILGVMPGSASLTVANELAPHLRAEHRYVDLAGAPPTVKEAVGDILRPSDARIGDGAIMSSPLEDGHRIDILASGPAAAWFQAAMAPWGMRVTTVGERLGAASGIKSLRSVFMKGMAALLVECALGSARYGVTDEVLGSIATWMDRRPFMASANRLLVTNVIHAERRAHEAAMSAEELAAAGVEPIVIRAAAERLQWLAALGLKAQLGAEPPAGYQQALAAIEQALRTPADGAGNDRPVAPRPPKR